jgi:hypothetical protein
MVPQLVPWGAEVDAHMMQVDLADAHGDMWKTPFSATSPAVDVWCSVC